MKNRAGPICSLGKLANKLFWFEKASLIDAFVLDSFDHLSYFDADEFDYLSPLIRLLYYWNA